MIGELMQAFSGKVVRSSSCGVKNWVGVFRINSVDGIYGCTERMTARQAVEFWSFMNKDFVDGDKRKKVAFIGLITDSYFRKMYDTRRNY